MPWISAREFGYMRDKIDRQGEYIDALYKRLAALLTHLDLDVDERPAGFVVRKREAFYITMSGGAGGGGGNTMVRPGDFGLGVGKPARKRSRK